MSSLPGYRHTVNTKKDLRSANTLRLGCLADVHSAGT